VKEDRLGRVVPFHVQLAVRDQGVFLRRDRDDVIGVVLPLRHDAPAFQVMPLTPVAGVWRAFHGHAAGHPTHALVAGIHLRVRLVQVLLAVQATLPALVRRQRQVMLEHGLDQRLRQVGT
jgi:hypothetical protein